MSAFGGKADIGAQDFRSWPLAEVVLHFPSFCAVVPQLEIFPKINVSATPLNSNDFG